MKLTKFGHCCLLIEEKGLKVLTDPGSYTSESEDLINTQNIDIILITHEHGDHLHIESLKEILDRNKNAIVITNGAVGNILSENSISFSQLEDKSSSIYKNVLIEAYGTKHAIMHSSVAASSNTGFFIADELFYPGDALTNPNKKIITLAVPVAGPWIKISEAIDYALELKPTKAFPVHDGMATSSAHRLPLEILSKNEIEFIVPEINKQYEI